MVLLRDEDIALLQWRESPYPSPNVHIVQGPWYKAALLEGRRYNLGRPDEPFSMRMARVWLTGIMPQDDRELIGTLFYMECAAVWEEFMVLNNIPTHDFPYRETTSKRILRKFNGFVFDTLPYRNRMFSVIGLGFTNAGILIVGGGVVASLTSFVTIPVILAVNALAVLLMKCYVPLIPHLDFHYVR